MDPALLKMLFPYLGIPGGMLAVLVICLQKGWLITAREARKDSDDCEEHKASWAERYKQLQKDMDETERRCDERIRDLTAERDRWVETALAAAHIARTATEKASEKIDGKT